jgi:DivIVA domain-containing protein
VDVTDPTDRTPMPLTPEEVQKKTFTPVRLREGYDMGEVDQFLDDVEVELTRLLTENADLRAQLTPATPNGGASVQPKDGQPGAAPSAATASGQSASAEQQPAQPAAAVSAPVVSTAAEASSAAARLLEIATNNAEQLVTEAHSDAERIVGEARSQAERLEADARSRADLLDKQTTEQRQHMLGDLQRDKLGITRELEELRAFEREYRSRLKSYFESQLRALDGEDDADDAPLPPSFDGRTSGRLRELLGDAPP